MFIIIVLLVIFFTPFIAGLFGNYSIMKLYGVKYIDPPEEEQEEIEQSEEDEIKEIQKQEKLDILDQTIVKYNRLIDSLAALYDTETDEKKKAAILRQQITALEKLNRALEKLEKLDQ